MKLATTKPKSPGSRRSRAETMLRRKYTGEYKVIRERIRAAFEVDVPNGMPVPVDVPQDTTETTTLFSRVEAAERVGVHQSTLSCWIEQGYLRPRYCVGKAWLFTHDDIRRATALKGQLKPGRKPKSPVPWKVIQRMAMKELTTRYHDDLKAFEEMLR